MNEELLVGREDEGQVQEYTEIGKYSTKCKGLNAELHLRSKKTDQVASGPPGFRKFVGVGNGKPYYYATVKFFKRVYDINEGADYLASFSIGCGCQSIEGIFQRLKYNEFGIEGLLANGPRDDDWKAERGVLSCILELERKVRKEHDRQS